MCDEVTTYIATNRGLIFKQLHKFGLATDHEAESIGYEALYNAATTFKPEMGYKFSTYATVCIYNALGSYVRTLLKQRQLVVVSYHAMIKDGEDGGIELVGLLACGHDVEQEYLQEELFQVVRAIFVEQLSQVTNEKHRNIICTWRASHFEMTTSDIAKNVGVSQSYVSQVLNNFKYSMRKRLEVYID
jgi:RNA polymerase sigma factor (sigma-70 family)